MGRGSGAAHQGDLRNRSPPVQALGSTGSAPWPHVTTRTAPRAAGSAGWWRRPTVALAAVTVAWRAGAHALGPDHGTPSLLVGEGAGWPVRPPPAWGAA